MNIACVLHGHDEIEDYTDGTTTFYVCRRCGNARREGPAHKKLNNKLKGGKIYSMHREMARNRQDG